MNTETIKPVMDAIDNDERWDSGELGMDETFIKAADESLELQKTIDAAVGLQMISIRLPTSLIEDFKFLGDVHGLKYQTLMRQVLARFAESEKNRLATKAAAAQIKASKGVQSKVRLTA